MVSAIDMTSAEPRVVSGSACARVLAMHASAVHGFSKSAMASIELVQGLGVKGDAHCGATVQHRSRVARDPSQANLRQVHVLQHELFDELRQKGFAIHPGDLGENITTTGVDLLSLPTGARLRLGADAVLELTGLRNPCAQIDDFQRGLMAAVLDRAPDGALLRKAGVMAVVLRGGVVAARDTVIVQKPARPGGPLQPV